ncbi:hypothetical protein [Pontibaca salina]|uniref:Lipoprotein n=1 Tax=Pontibaca salina TaxID=2795731 RepID=A0A934HJV8_9RHOB|nr:hypothetical protein [Pontibaca salina]MBI6629524.1 hypothetical protein [Pontibaca salina]
MSSVQRSALCLFAIGLAALAACGTPEYRAERKHCEAEWMLKIPPVYRQETVTKYRSERRPTGETKCESKGDTLLCQPVMEIVSVPYSALETVDIRKAQRAPQIESCAARACTARYGNRECKT